MCSTDDDLHKHVPVLGAWYYLDCPLAGHSLIACQMPPSTRKLAGRRNGQQKKKTRKHDEREQGCAKGEGEKTAAGLGKRYRHSPSPNLQGWSATSGTRTGYLFLCLFLCCSAPVCSGSPCSSTCSCTCTLYLHHGPTGLVLSLPLPWTPANGWPLERFQDLSRSLASPPFPRA
ncbi:hypothetical protein HDV62DRAFT_149569 [Trichoderma sp. SZMC 28011]